MLAYLVLHALARSVYVVDDALDSTVMTRQVMLANEIGLIVKLLAAGAILLLSDLPVHNFHIPNKISGDDSVTRFDSLVYAHAFVRCLVFVVFFAKEAMLRPSFTIDPLADLANKRRRVLRMEHHFGFLAQLAHVLEERG